MSTAWTQQAADAALETLDLLQEEIVRLEAEVARLQEGARDAAPEPRDDPRQEALDGRLAELTAALEERDQAIGLLCEQLAVLEEVGAARAAEWEQLDRWVRELESRIEREDRATPTPDGVEARDAAARAALAARERAWEAERTLLEREIQELRAKPAAEGKRAEAPDRARIEAENARLRDEVRRLAAIAAEVDATRGRASELEGQLGQALLKLGRAEDDLRRQGFEHEAELAALRASLASAKAAAPAELSVDDRLRAFRLHLAEVHEQEERDREQRQLIHRISRLWRRPEPRA